MTMTRWVGLACLLVALGCAASGATPIEGTIKYDGKPIDFGTITFENSNGSFPGPIQNGRFSVVVPTRAIRGEMTVKVESTLRTGRRIPARPPAPPNQVVDELIPLPPRYNTQSKLRFTPKPNETNYHEIELRSKE